MLTTYRKGKPVEVPAELVERAGIEDGEQLIVERNGETVQLRSARGLEPGEWYDAREFMAAARTQYPGE